MNYSLQEIVSIIEGEWHGTEEDVAVNGYSIDSRTLEKGDMFFAFKGERFDGHDFVKDALEAGAVAACVRRDFQLEGELNDRLIRCEDGLKALHTLASWSRNEPGLQVVGITGSCGKTTTKDLTATLLSSALRTGKNSGNYNNIWGQPLAFLRRPENCDVYVCEMGMSYPGELSTVTSLARPNIAVLTNVRAVHLVNFSSIYDVAKAKAEIFEGLQEKGIIVTNADDPLSLTHAEGKADTLLTFGFFNHADIYASKFEDHGIFGSRFVLHHPTGKENVEFRLPGQHNAANVLAAVAVGVAMGLDVAMMLSNLDKIALSPLRNQIIEFEDGWTVFNDSYNSNPSALSGVMNIIKHSKGFKRKIGVLGDMLELGVSEKELHWLAGSEIAKLKFDKLITVGRLSVNMARGAASEGMKTRDIIATENAEEAYSVLRELVLPEDLVVIKGSRGIKLEKVLEAMESEYKVKQG